MNIRFYLVALLATAITPSIAQTTTPAGQVIFKGAADSQYNGQTIVLYNNATNDIDSAKVADGAFEFKVMYKGPTRYFFYSKYEAKKKGGYTPYGVLVAAPGTVGFGAHMDDMASSVITGAPENDVYTAYSKAESKDWEPVEQKLIEKFGKDYQTHANPKDALYKPILAYYGQLAAPVQVAQKQRMLGFVKDHPDSFAAMYILQLHARDMSVDSLEQLYSQMGDQYKKTRSADYITNLISTSRTTAIGRAAPDFTQADTAGKPVKLSDFKGRYVLVDFWASWCGPCRAENPNVVKAYQQYHNKGFTVLGVSLDRAGDKDKWLNAIHHDQLMWTQVSDLQFWKNAAAVLYGVNAIPQNFLIGPDGKIIAKSLHGEELTAKLQEVLGAN